MTYNYLSSFFTPPDHANMLFILPPTLSEDHYTLTPLGVWTDSSRRSYQFIRVEHQGTFSKTVAILGQPSTFALEDATTWSRESLTLPTEATDAAGGLPVGTRVTLWWAVSSWFC